MIKIRITSVCPKCQISSKLLIKREEKKSFNPDVVCPACGTVYKWIKSISKLYCEIIKRVHRGKI